MGYSENITVVYPFLAVPRFHGTNANCFWLCNELRNKMKKLDETFLIKFLLCLMVSMQIVSGFVMKLKPFAGP